MVDEGAYARDGARGAADRPWGGSGRIRNPAGARSGSVEACAVCRTDLHAMVTCLIRICRSSRGTRSWAASTGSGWVRAGWRRAARRHRVAWAYLRRLQLLRSGPRQFVRSPLFTGYTRDGGFATHAVANAGYARLLEELLLTRFVTAPAMPSSACSARIKDFRRRATRFDRLATNFLAAISLAATVSSRGPPRRRAAPR